MLLSILDEKTFMIGTTTFKVGEKVNLGEMAPIVFPWGTTTVSALNEHLSQIAKRLRETRNALSNRLHVSEEAFDEEAANLALDYESLERDWLYYSDLFYKAIQANVGGNLPLIRNPDNGEITIRAKQPNETLNYLRDVCSQRVRFYNYEAPRHLAMHLAGNKRDNVSIESELHIDTQVPIVSATFENLDAERTRSWMEKAVRATYDQVIRYGAVAGILWVTEDRAYFLNAGALLRAGQGDPKLALTTAIQRCQGKLPVPEALGFFIYGNMPIVDEKARGVLLSCLFDKGEGAFYKILTVDQTQSLRLKEEGDDPTNLEVSQEGDEAKLDDAIIEVAKAAMNPPKEEPKEE